MNNFIAAVSVPYEKHPMCTIDDISSGKWFSLGRFTTKEDAKSAIDLFTQTNAIFCYCITSNVNHPLYGDLLDISTKGAV